MLLYLKRLSKDSILYGFGTAFGQLFSFILAPILTAIFSPSDYGIISLLQTMFGFMIMIALVNLGSGVYFYYFDIKDPMKRKVVISTSIIFHILIALFFSILIWNLAPYISNLLNIQSASHGNYNYSQYIEILSFGVFFSIMDTQFKSLLRMLRKPIKFTILTIIYVGVNFTLVMLLVVYLRMGIVGVFYAAIFSSAISSLVGLLMVKNEYVKAFSFTYLMLFFSYALPQFPSVFFNWGISQSGRFFLNYYSDLSEQGLYAIGLKVASVFLLFAIAFRLAWDPFALSIKDNSDAKLVYRKFYNYFMLIFVWLSASVALFGKPILMLFTPVEYHNAYIITAILSFAFLMQNINNIVGIGISITKKTIYISYIQFIVFVVVILLSFILIPTYNGVGAASVFLIASMMQGYLYFIVSERLYLVGYEFWKMNLYLFSAVIITVLSITMTTNIDSKFLLFSIASISSVFILFLSFLFFAFLEKKWFFKLRRDGAC